MKKQYVSPDMMFLIWGSNEDLCAKLGGRYLTMDAGAGLPTGSFSETSGNKGEMFS